MLKISMSAWTKTNIGFIENQTKTRQSEPELLKLKSSQFENVPWTVIDFRLFFA